MLSRVLEPEVMDTAEEAADYDAMDHNEVNQRFVGDFLAAASRAGIEIETLVRGQTLDVGTGTALIPIELCRRVPDIRVLAIDLAEEMLIRARSNIAQSGLAERIMVQRIDAKAITLDQGGFDAVISNSIIHHIPEPLTVLREMLRLTKPGGLLFVRDLLRPEDSAAVEHLVTQYAGEESPQQQQLLRQSLQAALTVDELRTLLQELGVAPESVQQTSDRHWTLAAIRE